jgi:hydroxymethylpyrimidine pyrophosphatase-like HAD family hydrolase
MKLMPPAATAPPPESADGPILIGLDVDGTLVPEGTIDIPQITADAAQDAVAAGHHIVLCSGRSLVGLLPIVAGPGLTSGWMIASNGAVIVRLAACAPGGYEITDAHMLDVAPVTELALQLAPGVRIAVEDVGVGYYVTHEFEPGTLNGRQKLVAPERLPDVTPRMVLRLPHSTGTTDTEALIARVGKLHVTATPASGGWWDITPAPLSKASALYQVRRRLGVHPDNTIAIGDGVNDLPAFKWAAVAVAMGDAPADVRAAADVVTGALAQHGAASVLQAIAADGGVAPRRLAGATVTG